MAEAFRALAPKMPPSWNLSPEDLQHVGQELQEFIGDSPNIRADRTRGPVPTLCAGPVKRHRAKERGSDGAGLAGPKVVRNLQRFVSEYQWNEGWMGTGTGS